MIFRKLEWRDRPFLLGARVDYWFFLSAALTIYVGLVTS